jgi:aerobic carbon-monoxide dehydrogenase small subunit
MEFILNGKNVETESAPDTRLLDILRNEFELTGTKEGCGEGECGACSVLIDGKLEVSCITACGSVKGKNVVTIEGFSGTKQYQVLSQAFSDCGAVQCGFCTPGMVLASQALLSVHPHPSEDEIREALSGNLCRCTGYNMIVTAVQTAAERGNGLW